MKLESINAIKSSISKIEKPPTIGTPSFVINGNNNFLMGLASVINTLYATGEIDKIDYSEIMTTIKNKII